MNTLCDPYIPTESYETLFEKKKNEKKLLTE